MANKSSKSRSDPKRVKKIVKAVITTAAVGYAGYQVITNPLATVRFLFNVFQNTSSGSNTSTSSIEKYGLTNVHIPESPRPGTMITQPNSRASITRDYFLS
jgi:hypothetical protein